MSEELRIKIEGKRMLNADFEGFTIKTDQPLDNGGDESAPSPMALFLASLGTCSGVYVKSFCDKRGIPTENIELIQKMNYNEESKLYDRIDIEIVLPKDFPEKYKKPLLSAVDLCTVKKHLLNPPMISVSTN